MQEKLRPQYYGSQDSQTDRQAAQMAGADTHQQDTAGKEQQQGTAEEEEQRQAKAAAKKAKKQRQKAKRQQAKGLTPPTSEPDTSTPQSLTSQCPATERPSTQSSVAQSPVNHNLDAQLTRPQSSTHDTEAQDSGSQSLEVAAQSSDPEHWSSTDDAMLDLFRCPITKVSHAAMTQMSLQSLTL